MEKLKYEQLAADFKFDFSVLSQAEQIGLSSLHPRVKSGFLRINGKSNLGKSQVLILEGYPGVDYENTVARMISENGGLEPKRPIYDLCYAENIFNPLRPTCIELTAGSGVDFCGSVSKLLDKLINHVDAEKLVNKIIESQSGLPEGSRDALAGYLSALSAKVLKGEPFTNEVIINLMVAHEKNTVPVIYGRDINWYTLFGKVNYLTEQGTTYSHQNLLEPGLVRLANGGYLVLPVAELVRQPLLWYKLSNALQTGSLDWVNNYQDGTSIVPFFEPEPTDINLTVVLTGDYLDLSEFYSLDINALEEIDLKVSMDQTIEADKTKEFLGYLNMIREKYDLLDFSGDAAGLICRYAQRECGTRTQFMIVETRLASIMKLASDIADGNGSEIVEKADMEKAIEEKRFRTGNIEKESTRMYEEGKIFISTGGSQIGQINGMSVVSTTGTDFEYGEPLRITATVHAGDGDISDVEYKANLAGQIHQKAMMIINGFLTNRFAQQYPLPFSINLVFEQSYSEIDGDSASLSGLCAVLSALANVPIQQNFAVTGALDQFGHVQPVGGLNEKIEGFYRVCKVKGISGNEGVIIPASNLNQLILNDEVMQAVKDEKFHIYTVNTIDETIEILTGIKAGDFEDPESIYGKIQTRILEMNIRNNGGNLNQGTSFWSRLFG